MIRCRQQDMESCPPDLYPLKISIYPEYVRAGNPLIADFLWLCLQQEYFI